MKKALLVLITLTLLLTTTVSARLGRLSEFESWLDGVMAAHLRDHNIAGATIAVVKRGKLFFYKGYGYADVANKKKVTPQTTLFRPGSCSKLFTWTAVMQLVEQGKLDLNTDINYYLKKFKIPNTFPKPITLAHLLTHTAGFEDRYIGLVATDYDDLSSLEQFLAENMPKRIWPAGKRAVYSNYGCALAGYIVQEASGILFEDYVKENIFEPLGMTNTTFDQQQTQELKRNLTKGYYWLAGQFVPQPFEFVNAVPAGAAVTTSLDMSKFIMAYLNNGLYNKTRILKPETVKLMQRQHYTYDPRIAGMCYGFYEIDITTPRVIGHGGTTDQFRSLLLLIPKEDVGLFVSYNSPGGKNARKELHKLFMARYYPSKVAKNKENATPDSKALSGEYLTNRRSYSTLTKTLQLLQPVDQVRALADDTLLFKGIRLIPTGSNSFRELYGKNNYVFNKLNGKLFLEFLPAFAFEKLAWYESIAFHWKVFWFCLLVFLSAVISWPILLVIDKSHHVQVDGSTIAIWLSIIASALFLVFFPIFLMNLDQVYFKPQALDWILVIPIIASLLAIGSLIYTILAWKNKYWSLIIRLHYTLVTLAMVLFVWWLNYWNLLGFKY